MLFKNKTKTIKLKTIIKINNNILKGKYKNSKQVIKALSIYNAINSYISFYVSVFIQFIFSIYI